ncbi:DUF3267 domain-containing protein [Flavobacterium humidisoli]|uniref:DUF3267 domain-containing protein n=1 Tax=Flavobacterium humidisoli TaxID=2937442 RepID=A0ABY4LY31_9FLAO|nr:DUF3267 domain-containing protein [Flavobacterium humidisoli]UPZ18004.1 DUF3267 domain-containing protein [Flavobacterium humidisoli]
MKEVFVKSKKISLIGVICILPLAALSIIPYWIRWNSHIKADIKAIKTSLSIFEYNILNSITVIIAPCVLIFIGIIVHELIHALFMAVFTKNGFKSVRLGIMKQSLIPYAQCKEPLKGRKMLVISLAPFIFLGLIPTLYAYAFGNLIFWFTGLVMTLSAIGDFVYAYLILKTGLEHKILDHTNEVGFIIIDND